MSEVYDEFANVDVHISFDHRLPGDLIDGNGVEIGGTELPFFDASTAQANDGEFCYR